MKSIAITSGKGGVGKTNIAVNLGLSLANSGKRVLLFDADMGLANVDILFGFSAKHNVADVLDQKLHLRDIIVKVSDKMFVLPATSGLLQLDNPSQSELAKLAEQMDELSHEFDVLLLDTGAGLRDTVFFFSNAAEEVLVITTPEPTALTDAYAMIKILNTNYNIPAIKLLVNEAIDEKEAWQIFNKLENVSKAHINVELDFAGWVAKDFHIEKAVRKRKPVMLGYPSAPSSLNFQQLARNFKSVFTSKPKPLVSDFWQDILQNRKQNKQSIAI